MVNKQDLLEKITSLNNEVMARLELEIDEKLKKEWKGSNIVQIAVDGVDQVVIEAIRTKYSKGGWTINKCETCYEFQPSEYENIPTLNFS